MHRRPSAGVRRAGAVEPRARTGGAPAVRDTGPLWRTTALVFLVALVVHAFLQWVPFRADVPVTDAWFHARYSWLLGTGGTPWNGLAFPYMAHSAYADRPVDWALGWHWVVAPFTLATAEPIQGMRVACVFFNAALATTFFWVLATGGCRRPILWTLLLHLATVHWLVRIHTCRPTPAAIIGLLLIWHFTTNRRPVAVAVSACLTLLVYYVPAVPAFVAGVSLLAVAATERRVPWRHAGAVAAGFAAGIVLHPGFWDVRGGPLSMDRGTFALWELISRGARFAHAEGRWQFANGDLVQFPVPTEMLGIGFTDLIGATSFGFVFVATAVAALAALMPPRRPRPISAAVLALGTMAMTMYSARFCDYWVPFATLAAAEALDGEQRKRSALRLWLVMAVGAAAVLTARPSVQAAVDAISDRRTREPAPACAALEKVTRPGDIVWHGNWTDFSPLFYESTSIRWTQGFDPWYLVAHDQEVARAQARLYGGDIEHIDDGELRDWITRTFGARFVLLWRRPVHGGGREHRYDPLIDRLRKMPSTRVVYEDAVTVVFEMR